MKLIIFTDGASRGNPGPASYGFTISDGEGKVVYEKGKCIGITTNNVAEYTGVLEAFKWIKENIKKKAQISLFCDSKLAAEQLSGRYKVKALHLKPIIQEIQFLAIELGGITFTHVPRERNARADALANEALDSC